MYVVFDMETSSKEKYKRKANPFYNRILCIGLKYQGKEAVGLSQDYMPRGWLEGVTVIIGHNISFDLSYIWRDEELQEFFRSGGRVWDTASAEFIISKQEHKFPKLRDIATQKYGCPERVKNIEKLFESGLETTDGDISLLLEDVKNDVLDTEAVALQQVKISKQQGTFNLIQARMDSLLATIEMSHSGVKVDLEVLLKNRNQLTEELEKCKLELNKLVEKYWKYE